MADVQRCMAWKKERSIEFKHPMRIICPTRLQTLKQRLNGSFSTASQYLSIILIKKQCLNGKYYQRPECSSISKISLFISKTYFYDLNNKFNLMHLKACDESV